MKTSPLSQTNPYLISPAMRQKLVERSVKTSGGVEGIKSSSKPSNVKIQRREKEIYSRLKPISQTK